MLQTQLFELAFHPGFDAGQGFGEFGGLPATAEGQVGCATAARAELARDVPDQLSGFETLLDQVLGHGSHHDNLFPGNGGDHAYAIARELFTEAIGQLAEGFLVHTGELQYEQMNRADRLHVGKLPVERG